MPDRPDREWFDEFAEAIGGEVVVTRDGYRVRLDEAIDPDDLREAMESIGPPPTEQRTHIGFDTLKEIEDEETGETSYEAGWIPGSHARTTSVAWDQSDEALDDWGESESSEGRSIVGVCFRFFG